MDETIFPTNSRAVPTRRLALHLSERRLLLFVGDLMLVAGAAALSLWWWSLRSGEIPRGMTPVEQSVWFIGLAIGWIAAASLFELYDPQSAGRRLHVARQLFAIAVLHTGVYLAIFFVSPPNSLPRAFFLTYVSVLTVAMLVWRWTYASVFTLPRFRRRALIAGAGWAGQTLVGLMLKAGISQYEILGLVDDDPCKSEECVDGVPVLGASSDILRISQENGADEVILAITGQVSSSVFRVLANCQEQGLRVVRMAEVYEQLTGRVPVDHAGQSWLIDSLSQSHAQLWIYRTMKRSMDLGVGLIVGVAFLLTFPAVALATRLTSPGPIFYRQVRVGLCGKPFQMIKFRSMMTDAEADGKPRWAVEGDPRVTKVGRILRRARLDELPQAINILRGEMSLVGPRPERPSIVATLQDDIPYYRARLLAKPGLTGWAQVNYEYGNSKEDALVKLEYDLYYLKHQSLWFDLLILARTIGVILGFKGM